MSDRNWQDHYPSYQAYMCCALSDLHKEIYGIRPRWMYEKFHRMSENELDDLYRQWLNEANDQAADEEAQAIIEAGGVDPRYAPTPTPINNAMADALSACGLNTH